MSKTVGGVVLKNNHNKSSTALLIRSEIHWSQCGQE